MIFGEGPVWDARGKQLFYTDIIGDTIWRWKPGGKPKALLRPSRKANGMCLDLENRRVVAGWGGRTVFRFEKNGSRKTLADRWEGKKLNSPNDIVVKSDGSIWFTDPTFGILANYEGYKSEPEIEANVYRLEPGTNEATIVAEGVLGPNGL